MLVGVLVVVKLIPILAIVAITALEGFALARGVNGTGLSLALAAIAGLGGFQVHKWTASRRQDKQPMKEEGETQP